MVMEQVLAMILLVLILGNRPELSVLVGTAVNETTDVMEVTVKQNSSSKDGQTSKLMIRMEDSAVTNTLTDNTVQVEELYVPSDGETVVGKVGGWWIKYTFITTEPRAYAKGELLTDAAVVPQRLDVVKYEFPKEVGLWDLRDGIMTLENAPDQQYWETWVNELVTKLRGRAIIKKNGKPM